MILWFKAQAFVHQIEEAVKEARDAPRLSPRRMTTSAFCLSGLSSGR